MNCAETGRFTEETIISREGEARAGDVTQRTGMHSFLPSSIIQGTAMEPPIP